MGENTGDISIRFQNDINSILENMELTDQFTFLSDMNEFVQGCLNNLIESSYIEIANKLKDDELRKDSVHDYVAIIIEALQIYNRTPVNIETATEDLFEFIDDLERKRIEGVKEDPESQQRIIMKYLKHIAGLEKIL